MKQEIKVEIPEWIKVLNEILEKNQKMIYRF